MNSGEIRIGIVGAGDITRNRHLPGFRAIPGVRLVAVCNRRRETATRIAREFEIAKVYNNWEDLVADPEVEAVVIGTWPYLHCSVTLAAFDAGKHVLTQARMAMNAREAQRMHDRSTELPHLAAMVVPSPYGLTGDLFVRSLLDAGLLGDLREIHVVSWNDQLADPATPMSWRQMTRYSGFNMLTLGIVYETLLRWVSPADRVLAYASKLVPVRLDPESGKKARVGTPDCVQVLTTHEGGARGELSLSGVIWHDARMEIGLYGSRGTLIYDLLRDEIRGAKRSHRELKTMPIPEKFRGGWQVEADFIAAIRGERPVTRTDFATGVQYMQFTEAVARSSRHQMPVTLPLREFSNPSL
jgi:predicted dehydrogenase